jgi:hypothetical protein
MTAHSYPLRNTKPLLSSEDGRKLFKLVEMENALRDDETIMEHDLESKLAAALEDELIGRVE